MKKVLVGTTIVFFLLVVSLYAKDEKSGDYTQGKKLYEQNCQICHGANGKGDGPLAETLVNIPANLTSSKILKNDPKKLITNAIENGYRTMPPVDLSGDQVTKVIDYIVNTF